MATTDGERYVSSLRTPAKRRYAELYLSWLLRGAPRDEEPDRGPLSYMVAQAVEMNLNDTAAGEVLRHRDNAAEVR